MVGMPVVVVRGGHGRHEVVGRVAGGVVPAQRGMGQRRPRVHGTPVITIITIVNIIITTYWFTSLKRW